MEESSKQNLRGRISNKIDFLMNNHPRIGNICMYFPVYFYWGLVLFVFINTIFHISYIIDQLFDIYINVDLGSDIIYNLYRITPFTLLWFFPLFILKQWKRASILAVHYIITSNIEYILVYLFLFVFNIFGYTLYAVIYITGFLYAIFGIEYSQ